MNATDSPAQSGEIGVLKTSSVSAGAFDATKNKLVLKEDVGRVTCPVTAGTLIVNRANTPALVGAAGLVRESAPGLFLSDKLWQLSFRATAAAEFIYYWTQTDLYRIQLSSIRVGTSSSMQNIPYEGFRNMGIAVPPLSEQQSIVEHLDGETSRIGELVNRAFRVVDVLRERRAALITAAVTGKIDVRGAA